VIDDYENARGKDGELIDVDELIVDNKLLMKKVDKLLGKESSYDMDEETKSEADILSESMID
jgi:hypothetical protein